jgi:hypothetical protein
MAALWLSWRPKAEGFNYQSALAFISQNLPEDPVGYLRKCADALSGGWIRSFTADSDVHWLAKAVFGIVGLLGVAGAVLRARSNRIDGWYVLATLPVVFLWLFPEDNTRRLLYPLVPLLIIHAAVFIAFIARKVPSQRHRRMLVAAVVALPVLLCLPAWLLVQSKSMDRDKIYPGLRYRYSDMTDYYTTIDVKVSRARASQHAAILGGLESLGTVTPPGSRVMWVRPDYVVVLGNRQGVPWYYRWSHGDFLREVKRSKVDYIITSSLMKSDMEGVPVDLSVRFDWALQVSDVVHSMRSHAMEGYEIAVLKVDPAVIDEMLKVGRP